MLQYIENHPELQDIVVSGGDAFYLEPEHLLEIGQRYVASHINKAVLLGR